MDKKIKSKMIEELIIDDIDVEILTTLDDWVSNNIIGSADIIPAKTLLTWMSKGKVKAKEICAKCVKNLTDSGFANEDGYLVQAKFETEEEKALWIIMAIAGANGYISQSID